MSWGFAIVNGILGHLVPLLTQTGELKYVPGAVQSVFMVAFGFFILLGVYKRLGVVKGCLLPLLFGLIFHITGLIMPVFASQVMPDEIVWPVFVAVTGVFPVLMMPLLKERLKLKAWKTKNTW